MSNYTAIILAAGQGTRLRPLTDDIPKCMVQINGKPILEWQIDLFTEAGIENIVVVTGYLEDKIQYPQITKVHNADYASTNMVYSLFCAEEYLQGDVVISYGDIVYSEEVLQKLMDSDDDIVIASDEEWLPYWKQRCDDPLSDAETFQKAANSKVHSLGQEPESAEDIEGQFIGLTKLTDKGSVMLRQAYFSCKCEKFCTENAWESNRSLHNAYMTDLLNSLAGDDKLSYTPIHRGWFEVDTPSDLAVAEKGITTKKPI